MLLKRKKYLSGLFAVLCLAVMINFTAVSAHRALLQQGIAEEVLRFHVLANSDTEADQAIKLKVRDAVLKKISSYELANYNKAEIKLFLKKNMNEIVDTANLVLMENNMGYAASAEIEQCYFPERTYGACTFPAGWYEALRIRLGEAKGKNWWCVLYPGLCFSDYLHAVADKEALVELEEILTIEEYESLLKKPKQWKIGFRWF